MPARGRRGLTTSIPPFLLEEPRGAGLLRHIGVRCFATMAKIRNARPRLIAHALSLPDAWEDHPWNETVAKVGKKIFVFFGKDEPESLFVGVKLSRSLAFARTRPFVQKFGYGLDASGWAAARFGKDDDVPLDLLLEWIDESYEGIAPKVPRRKSATVPTVARTPPRRASK